MKESERYSEVNNKRDCERVCVWDRVSEKETHLYQAANFNQETKSLFSSQSSQDPIPDNVVVVNFMEKLLL